MYIAPRGIRPTQLGSTYQCEGADVRRRDGRRRKRRRRRSTPRPLLAKSRLKHNARTRLSCCTWSTYTHTHTHTHTHRCMCVYISSWCVFVCIIWMCVCVCVCVCVCTYVWMYVYVCMHVCIYIYYVLVSPPIVFCDVTASRHTVTWHGQSQSSLPENAVYFTVRANKILKLPCWCPLVN